MNGNSIVADTSTLINFLNGSEIAKEFLEDKDIWISGITEIELLSSPKLSNEERKLVRSFIRQLTVVDLIPPVKEIAASLRVSKILKLPDSIIAATAIYFNFPLFTYDKAFSKANDLTLFLLK